jgi:hypothetical protein
MAGRKSFVILNREGWDYFYLLFLHLLNNYQQPYLLLRNYIEKFSAITDTDWELLLQHNLKLYLWHAILSN